jgi:hypothetical protein
MDPGECGEGLAETPTPDRLSVLCLSIHTEKVVYFLVIFKDGPRKNGFAAGVDCSFKQDAMSPMGLHLEPNDKRQGRISLPDRAHQSRERRTAKFSGRYIYIVSFLWEQCIPDSCRSPINGEAPD